MSPGQALPSFNLALHPSDHYKTVLPNLAYPSRPITHIPWCGSSSPLLFSVSQTIFSSCFATGLLFFCPQKTTRHEMTIAASVPIVQVSHISLSI